MPALGSVYAVVANRGFAKPGGIAAGAPTEIRRIYRRADRRQDGEAGDRAGDRTEAVSKDYLVVTSIRRLGAWNRVRGIGRARNIRSIELPAVTKLRPHS